MLQTTLDQEPSRWELAVDLGRLLGRLGRWDAAARVVQRIPSTARERADAVLVLVDAFDALGWSHAAAESRVEAGVGGTERPDAAAIAGASIAVPRGSLFGRYAVVREVASSPRARVLECTDPVLGETVAVKVFAAIDGNPAEAAAAARPGSRLDVLALRGSRHPAVVPVLEYLPQGPATVQAWMPGGDLEGMLGRFGALAPARAVEVACARYFRRWRRGARDRRAAPGGQAHERPLRRGGRRAPRRLRVRAALRRRGDGDDRAFADARVRGAGAPPGPRADRAERRLLGRRDAPRDAHRGPPRPSPALGSAAQPGSPRARRAATTRRVGVWLALDLAGAAGGPIGARTRPSPSSLLDLAWTGSARGPPWGRGTTAPSVTPWLTRRIPDRWSLRGGRRSVRGARCVDRTRDRAGPMHAGRHPRARACVRPGRGPRRSRRCGRSTRPLSLSQTISVARSRSAGPGPRPRPLRR